MHSHFSICKEFLREFEEFVSLKATREIAKHKHESAVTLWIQYSIDVCSIEFVEFAKNYIIPMEEDEVGKQNT